LSLYAVDIEADGPAPGLYSMLSIGIVAVRPGLDQTFYAELAPVSDRWIPEAMEVNDLDRERLKVEGLNGYQAMAQLRSFVADTSNGKAVFVSDNPGFDYGFVNYYCWAFPPPAPASEANPFGHSARRIGDIWSGLQGDMFNSGGWRDPCRTAHTHNALDDAKGFAEALLELPANGWKASFE